MSDDLRSRLNEIRDGLLPRSDEATLEGVARRRRKRQLHRRYATIGVSFLIAAASISIAIRAFPTNGPARRPAGQGAVTPVVGRSVQIGPHGQTTAMVAGFGKLWVTAYGVQGGQGVDEDA